jgi:DNA polymerase III epsilon subunit-like protein
MVGIGPKATTSELARLSAIDWFTGELVIDALVQPDCVVTDWRTKWSGITAEIMEVAVTSGDALKGSSAARAELFKYMDSSTVLVGHALRYDLAALGIHHNVMVDSAVLAKEAVGKNVRRDWGLKTLCTELLGVTVQDHGNDGHDSVEDALAAREVVLWCLEHNAELKKWGRKKRKEYYANDKKKTAMKRNKRYTDVSLPVHYDDSDELDEFGFRCVSLEEYNEMCEYPAWYDNWSD